MINYLRLKTDNSDRRVKMNVAERVKAVLDGRMPDAVPMLIYSNHLPRGEFERNLRNIGLGLDVRCSVYRSYMPKVKVEENRQLCLHHLQYS